MRASAGAVGAVLAAGLCLLAPAPARAAVDLTIIAVTGPAGGTVGQTVTFTDTVKNIGSSATTSGGFNVDYFLSTDAVYSEDDAYLGSRPVFTDLAAGSSDTWHLSFTVPAVSSGTYRVIAVADAANAASDPDTSNNAAAASFAVTAAGGGGGGGTGQDLAVTTVTAAALVTAGQNITLRATVKNIGSDPSGTFYVYYHLSTGTVYSAGANHMLGYQAAAGLAAGQSAPLAYSLPVPYVAQGGYYVIAVASAAEANQANNALASVRMTVANDIDLAVTSVTAPAAATVGQVITATDTVRNNGPTTTAGTFRTGYYLSTDASWSGDDALIGYRVVPSLAAGTASTGSVHLTLPSVTQGSYFVLAVADARADIAETDEGNNVLAAARLMTVANSLDLAVTTVTAPATAAIGQAVVIADTVQNLGANSTGTFQVGYYLSADEAWSGGDTLLATRTAAAIAGGASDSGSLTVAVPAVAPGRYYLIAVADTLRSVTETDEGNNALARPMTITGSADLSLAALSAPAAASTIGTITVNDTVANIGLVPAGAFDVSFYLSTDTAFSVAVDTLVGSRSILSLAAGASDLGSTSVTLPAVPQGSYRLIAVADQAGTVSETNRSNNWRASGPIALSENPDLVPSMVSMPDAVTAGAALTINDSVSNVGADAAGAFTVSLYLSTDSAYSVAADTWIGNRAVAYLAPNASSAGATTVNVPAALRGDYYVIVAADPGGAVPEVDETNNALASASRIHIRWPAPGTPGKPAGAVLGTSSITWTWTPAGNAQQYSVYSASAPLAAFALLTATAAVQAGLSPNATGSVRVAASNADGAGTVSPYGDPVFTLAAPPGAVAVSGVSDSGAALTWGLGPNPPGTVAEVQRSTDGASFSLVSTRTTAGIVDEGLMACTPYWYRVRNRNGDGVATDFAAAAQFQTLASTPAPPSGLSAQPRDGNRIFLSWGPSVSEGITEYRLYFDGGSGSVAYGVPLAVFSSTETGWTTGVLASSAAYAFGLRAVNRCGVEEANTGVTASAGSAAALSPVRAAVVTPAAGQRVWGHRVTVAAELVSGDASRTRQVLFQYRPAGAAAWTDVPAADTDHPNPALRAPFFVRWDAQSSGAGSYQLRAVADGVSTGYDPSPSAVGVSAGAVDPDILETPAQKDQKVSNAVANTVSAGDGNSSLLTRLDLPSGALSTATATLTVANNPALKPPPPPGVPDLGLVAQFGLSNGQTQLSAGRTATVTMSYPDADGDGVLDGSPGRVARLRMYSAQTAAGPWTPVTAVTDTRARSVAGLTQHFSFFALFAPAADDLRAVRVFPNPFKPNSGNPDSGVPYSRGDPASGIVFDNLPEAAAVRILTLTGQTVVRLGSSSTGGRLQWDAKTDQGRDAASGLYFAVISSPGQDTVVKKLLIAR